MDPSKLLFVPSSGKGAKPKTFQAGSSSTALPTKSKNVKPDKETKRDLASRNQQWQTIPKRRRGNSGAGNHGGSSSAARANQEEHKWETKESSLANKSQHHLNFTSLKKLIAETVEPSEIIRKLMDGEGGLKKLLKDHPNQWDLIELVLIALGNFCEKDGVESFSSDFIAVVHILAQHEVFRNVSNVVLQIATAPASSNMLPKEERMKRLIKGIYQLGVAMLIKIPAFSCNHLGQNFFIDIHFLKDAPSVKVLKQDEGFQLLEDGCNRLKVLTITSKSFHQEWRFMFCSFLNCF